MMIDPHNIRANATPRHKELHTGTDGAGHTQWLVVVVTTETGAWHFVHRFDSEDKARNWMKWC